MRRLVALLPLLALVACGDATVSPRSDGTTPPAPTYAAGAEVLTVSFSGGLRPPTPVDDMPFWSLYGDGRVITRGPELTIYPGYALPNLRVTRVSPATVRRIVTAAREAGVDAEQRDYGTPRIADAANTDFVLTDEHGTVTRSVYALAEGSNGSGYTEAQKAARQRLIDFQNHLTDLNGWLGAGTAPDDEDYAFTSLAVLARRYDHDEQQVTVQEIAWRGADPAAGEALGDGVAARRCTVVTGASLETVRPDLRRANTLTRWTYGGAAWAFELRPLLPHEKSCQDLT